MGRDAMMRRAITRLARIALVATGMAVAGGTSAPAADQMRFISIGSGATSGVYYPIGRGICRILNQAAAGTVRCSVESTPGSVYNAARISSGELDFALVQSDTQFNAYGGHGIWTGKAVTGMRSVMSLHPELLTIVARDGTALRLDALKRSRINVGAAGSGARSAWRALEEATGWSAEERVKPSELKADMALSGVCRGDLDATLLLVGHPSTVVRDHLAACPLVLVPVEGAVVDTLVRAKPFYRRGVIPARIYGNALPVPSIGVSALLVTDAKTDPELVRTLVLAVFANLQELRAAHPALADLVPAAMAGDAMTAPLHPGAEKAYRELGLRP
ncbi:MAG: TAXI family TRAP transporter solute-binding subunit [Alsobacter sp.]